MRLCDKNGAIPVIIIIAIAIATVGGSLIGFGVYMATHALTAIMVTMGFALIFILFVLPNLSLIVLWYKKVKREVSYSIKEINNDVKSDDNVKSKKD